MRRRRSHPLDPGRAQLPASALGGSRPLAFRAWIRARLFGGLLLIVAACGSGRVDICEDAAVETVAVLSDGGTFSGNAYLLSHGIVIHDVALDAEGAAWYAAQSTGCIGVLTGGSRVTHRSAGDPGALHGLAWDEHDRGVWHGGQPGFLTLLRKDGTSERIRVEEGARIHSVAAARGTVWFTTEHGVGYHHTQSGRTGLWPTSGEPYDVAAGQDVDVWFTIPDRAVLGRIGDDDAGEPRLLYLPDGSWPLRLAIDDEGTVWFTDWRNARVGAVTAGADSAVWFALPSDAAFPRGIAATSGAQVWTYSESTGQILRLDPAYGWIDRASVPVIGRHLMSDRQGGRVWVSGGEGLLVIIASP